MRRFVPSALAVLVVLVLLVQVRSRGAPLPAVPCTRAVMLDGLLRCDEAAPERLAAVCGEGHAGAALRIETGDALETATVCGSDAPHRGAPGWGRMEPADLRALGQPVDINTASVEELRSLPGVGRKIASRIIEGRPYAAPDELVRVRGIGPKTLARLRPRLTGSACTGDCQGDTP